MHAAKGNSTRSNSAAQAASLIAAEDYLEFPIAYSFVQMLMHMGIKSIFEVWDIYSQTRNLTKQANDQLVRAWKDLNFNVIDARDYEPEAGINPVRDLWVRDLTAEGIEPNPGPPKGARVYKAKAAPPAPVAQERAPTYQEILDVVERRKAAKKLLGIPEFASNKEIEKKFEKKVEKKVEKKALKTVERAVHESKIDHSAAFEKGLIKLTSPLTKVLTMPFQNGSFRVPTLSTQKTAIANPFSLETVPWALNDHILPSSEMVWFVFRNPLRATIVYQPNDSLAPFSYNLNFYDPSSNASSTTFQCVNETTNRASIIPTVINATASTSFTPHDKTWFPGRIQGHADNFFWYDPGVAITITPTANTLTGTEVMVVEFVRWLPGGYSQDVELGRVTAGSSTPITYSPTVAGYYAFQCYFEDSAGNVIEGRSVSFTARIWSNNASTWGHRCLPDFSANMFAVDKIRVLSAACLYSERASPLNAQGTVMGAQVPGNRPWLDFVEAGLTKIGKVQGVVDYPAKTGFYGYLRPTDQVRDFEYVEGYTVENDVPLESFYWLDKSSDYLVFHASVTTDAGRDARFNFAFSVEYMTTDTWRSVRQPEFDDNRLDLALRRLKKVRQFFQNGTHIMEIWKALTTIGKDLADGALNYVPKFAGMFKQLK